MAEHPFQISARYDLLVRTFGDDDIAHCLNAFRDDGVSGRKPQQTSTTGVASTASLWNTSGEPQCQHQQANQPSEDFVSAYVVIDPSQPDRILVPHQLLTYTPPGTTEPIAISWGPVVLPSSLLKQCPINQEHPQRSHQSALLQELPRFVHSSLDNANKNKEASRSERNHETLPLPHSVTSAKIRGKTQSSASTLTQKRKGRPKRTRIPNANDAETGNGKARVLKPLTAYNFYYRDERDNIVLATGDEIPPPVIDFSEAKRQKLLEDRWLKDPTKGKRKHRRTHGKMEFTQ